MIPLFFVISVILIVGIIGGISGILWFRQHKRFLAMTHYNKGVSSLQAGDGEKAITEFTAALQRQHTHTGARYGLGLAYLKQQRYRESLPLLERAVKEMPRDAIALCNLGWAKLNTGKLDQAQHLLEKALQVNPALKEVYFTLGSVYKDRGDRELATNYYRQALQIDAGYSHAQKALEELSQIQYETPVDMGLIRKAMQHFDHQDTEFMIRL
ncbi:hypothetical protein CSA56_16085 [candidate division KSB3 bacterium]|uniref:Uncharacterized protein n=1 Tax=candidate division KSB3 bacterium TaxID=2044937 RepID=A0A2G6K8U6_9BACT|nr:MAG: hypothetical protein CSA56_16085 [candidate division KSB3 bacterium]